MYSVFSVCTLKNKRNITQCMTHYLQKEHLKISSFLGLTIATNFDLLDYRLCYVAQWLSVRLKTKTVNSQSYLYTLNILSPDILEKAKNIFMYS